jgi:hypothetical protein
MVITERQIKDVVEIWRQSWENVEQDSSGGIARSVFSQFLSCGCRY